MSRIVGMKCKAIDREELRGVIANASKRVSGYSVERRAALEEKARAFMKLGNKSTDLKTSCHESLIQEVTELRHAGDCGSEEFRQAGRKAAERFLSIPSIMEQKHPSMTSEA